MAYVSNDLILTAQGCAGAPGKVWTYRNTAADTAATIDTSGFISDARLKGMTVGDLVLVYNPATGTGGMNMVQAINANGSADLTDAVAMTTDTD